jgi:hypothetical protein
MAALRWLLRSACSIREPRSNAFELRLTSAATAASVCEVATVCAFSASLRASAVLLSTASFAMVRFSIRWECLRSRALWALAFFSNACWAVSLVSAWRVHPLCLLIGEMSPSLQRHCSAHRRWRAAFRSCHLALCRILRASSSPSALAVGAGVSAGFAAGDVEGDVADTAAPWAIADRDSELASRNCGPLTRSAHEQQRQQHPHGCRPLEYCLSAGFSRHLFVPIKMASSTRRIAIRGAVPARRCHS